MWGTAVARLTTNVWFDPYLVFKRGLGVSPIKYYIDYLKKGVQVVIIGAVCYFLANKVPSTSLGYLFVKAAIAFGVSFGVIFLMYCRTEEFRYLWNVIRNFKSIMKNRKE